MLQSLIHDVMTQHHQRGKWFVLNHSLLYLLYLLMAPSLSQSRAASLKIVKTPSVNIANYKSHLSKVGLDNGMGNSSSVLEQMEPFALKFKNSSAFKPEDASEGSFRTKREDSSVLQREGRILKLFPVYPMLDATLGMLSYAAFAVYIIFLFTDVLNRENPIQSAVSILKRQGLPAADEDVEDGRPISELLKLLSSSSSSSSSSQLSTTDSQYSPPLTHTYPQSFISSEKLQRLKQVLGRIVKPTDDPRFVPNQGHTLQQQQLQQQHQQLENNHFNTQTNYSSFRYSHPSRLGHFGDVENDTSFVANSHYTPVGTFTSSGSGHFGDGTNVANIQHTPVRTFVSSGSAGAVGYSSMLTTYRPLHYGHTSHLGYNNDKANDDQYVIQTHYPESLTISDTNASHPPSVPDKTFPDQGSAGGLNSFQPLFVNSTSKSPSFSDYKINSRLSNGKLGLNSTTSVSLGNSRYKFLTTTQPHISNISRNNYLHWNSTAQGQRNPNFSSFNHNHNWKEQIFNGDQNSTSGQISTAVQSKFTTPAVTAAPNTFITAVDPESLFATYVPTVAPQTLSKTQSSVTSSSSATVEPLSVIKPSSPVLMRMPIRAQLPSTAGSFTTGAPPKIVRPTMSGSSTTAMSSNQQPLISNIFITTKPESSTSRTTLEMFPNHSTNKNNQSSETEQNQVKDKLVSSSPDGVKSTRRQPFVPLPIKTLSLSDIADYISVDERKTPPAEVSALTENISDSQTSTMKTTQQDFATKTDNVTMKTTQQDFVTKTDNVTMKDTTPTEPYYSMTKFPFLHKTKEEDLKENQNKTKDSDTLVPLAGNVEPPIIMDDPILTKTIVSDGAMSVVTVLVKDGINVIQGSIPLGVTMTDSVFPETDHELPLFPNSRENNVLIP